MMDDKIISGNWGYACVKNGVIWIPAVMGDLGKILSKLYEETGINRMIFSAILNPDELKKHLKNIVREWDEWVEEFDDYSHCIEIHYQPKKRTPMDKKKTKIQHFTWMPNDEWKREILDECKVTSWENPRKEIEDYIKKEYRKDSNIKIYRIINEKKVHRCPRELIWDSLIRQDYQGRCTYCGYHFVNFVGREKNKPENFKYCLGFGSSSLPGRDKFVILYECPECFEKTYFHVDEKWIYLFGEWIVDESIYLKDTK